MIEWQDNAIILSARAQGETAVLLSVLTRTQGRHMGILPGGQSRSKSAYIQPGQQVQLTWRARLPDQLGTFRLEPLAVWPTSIMDNAQTLTGLSAACALLDATLAERETHPALYDSFLSLLDALSDRDIWPYVYIRWELGLLAELGYGIDLSRCAVTGQKGNLTHVSPKTGRAVCAEVANPYRERLLPLPAFLLDDSAATHAPEPQNRDYTPDQIPAGLRLCGYFLARHVFMTSKTQLPPARLRLASLFDP